MLINNSTILIMQLISIMLSLMINDADVKFSFNYNYDLINKSHNKNPHGIERNELFIAVFNFIYNIYTIMNLVHISTNKNYINYATPKILSIAKFYNTNITTNRKPEFIVLWNHYNLYQFVYMLIYLVHISGNTKNINYDKKLQKFN
eukprot:546843_1